MKKVNGENYASKGELTSMLQQAQQRCMMVESVLVKASVMSEALRPGRLFSFFHPKRARLIVEIAEAVPAAVKNHHLQMMDDREEIIAKLEAQSKEEDPPESEVQTELAVMEKPE